MRSHTDIRFKVCTEDNSYFIVSLESKEARKLLLADSGFILKELKVSVNYFTVLALWAISNNMSFELPEGYSWVPEEGLVYKEEKCI